MKAGKLGASAVLDEPFGVNRTIFATEDAMAVLLVSDTVKELRGLSLADGATRWSAALAPTAVVVPPSRMLPAPWRRRTGMAPP
jgi:hypothetical protein